MSINQRNRLFILFLGAFLFLPFLGRVHLFDWDEINFAEASREMIVTGNYLQVQIDYKPFWEKPPLFFWLQTLAMRAFGINEYSARLIDALFGILTLLIVYGIGRRLFDPLFGMLWALAFAGSLLPHVFFKSGIIDPVFNLFIFSGIYLFILGADSLTRKKRLPAFSLSGALIGLAMLAKGPVALLIILLCIAVYWASGRFKAFVSIKESMAFLATMALVSLSWYGVETIAHGTWFISEFVKYQFHLLTRGEAGHGRPAYFHPLVLLFGCFPASFLALRSFFCEITGSKEQKDFVRWMKTLFWVVLILFSMVKTKTVLYSSLAYYPIAFLAAYHMHAVCRGKLQWSRAHTVFLAAFGLLVALVIAAFPIVMMHRQWITPLIQDPFAVECLKRPVPWFAWESLIGIFYAILLCISVALAYRNKFRAAFSILFLSTALCLQMLMLDIVPKVEAYADKGPIDFYIRLQGKNCYPCSLFKTYADLFYAGKMPGSNPKSRDRLWLLTGPIDKPAYFVCRSHQAQEVRENYGSYGVKQIKTEYGFSYFRREAQEVAGK